MKELTFVVMKISFENFVVKCDVICVVVFVCVCVCVCWCVGGGGGGGVGVVYK